ncbi:MAG: hypothetical protein M3P01_01880 [Actinomycetota bacterium]|nr:hypothetical protein [Actinomycetota bacterium]
MQLQMESQTSLSPEEALAAITDFSPRRPQMWTGISPQYYEVYEVGETSADIREGTKRGGLNVWAKEHYDWSEPGTVTWTVKESNFCTPGSYVKAEIRPRDGGGSIIRCTWDRTATSVSGRFVFAVMRLTRGKAIETSMRKGLGNYERELSG